MGSSLAALKAGNKPARTPTAALKRNGDDIASTVMTGVFSVGETRVEHLHEAVGSGEARHAAEDGDDDAFDQDLDEDSTLVAPMALRMPISRMRSVMLASMMFMMPMPPTSRLMAAMMPPLMRALLMAVSDVFGPVLLGLKEKSSMPLCVCIRTFLRLLQRRFQFSMSATLMLTRSRRGSGTTLVPVADLNFSHIVLSGM